MSATGMPKSELMEFNEKRIVPGETAQSQAEALLRILKSAHWTNLVVRTNGRTILYEADFLKGWLQEGADCRASGDKEPRETSDDAG